MNEGENSYMGVLTHAEHDEMIRFMILPSINIVYLEHTLPDLAVSSSLG